MVDYTLSSYNKAVVMLHSIAPIAQELQRTNPEIAKKWKGGYTLRKIVEEYNLCSCVSERCSEPEKVAENIAMYCLIGMRGGNVIEGFNGLVSIEEYKKESKKRSLENISNYRAINKGKMGTARLNEEQVRNMVRKGVESRVDYRGLPRTPAINGEAEFAYLLSSEEGYYSAKRVLWKNVACEINKMFHNGEPVRTPSAAKNMFYGLQNKKSKRKPAIAA